MTLKCLARTAVFALLASPSCAADTVYGLWQRDNHEEQMFFFDCGGALCARGALPMRDGTESPMILRAAKKAGDNHWKGDLFNPENSKTYNGEIKFEPPNRLTLTGCLIAFLCQSETWTKLGPLPPQFDQPHPPQAHTK
jgi:uncharacterized protein (DUF2147 family)